MVARIRDHFVRWHYGLWAVQHKQDGHFIGFIGLHHHRWFPDDVEIGWRLDPSYWGQGLATEGGRAGLQFGFDQLALDHVISIIDRENIASRKVAEKLDMAAWQDFAHPDTGAPIVVYRKERGA